MVKHTTILSLLATWLLVASVSGMRDLRPRQGRMKAAMFMTKIQHQMDPKFCMPFAKDTSDCCKLPNVLDLATMEKCAVMYPVPRRWLGPMCMRGPMESDGAMKGDVAATRKRIGQPAVAAVAHRSSEETGGKSTEVDGVAPTKQKLMTARGVVKRDLSIGEIPPGFRGPCPLDCYFNTTGLYTENSIDVDKVKAAFLAAPNLDSSWNEPISEAVAKCAEDVKGLNLTALPKPLLNRQQCQPYAKFFIICFYRELFLKCPASLSTRTDECTATITGIEGCDPLYIPPFKPNAIDKIRKTMGSGLRAIMAMGGIRPGMNMEPDKDKNGMRSDKTTGMRSILRNMRGDAKMGSDQNGDTGILKSIRKKFIE